MFELSIDRVFGERGSRRVESDLFFVCPAAKVSVVTRSLADSSITNRKESDRRQVKRSLFFIVRYERFVFSLLRQLFVAAKVYQRVSAWFFEFFIRFFLFDGRKFSNYLPRLGSNRPAPLRGGQPDPQPGSCAIATPAPLFTKKERKKPAGFSMHFIQGEERKFERASATNRSSVYSIKLPIDLPLFRALVCLLGNRRTDQKI